MIQYCRMVSSDLSFLRCVGYRELFMNVCYYDFDENFVLDICAGYKNYDHVSLMVCKTCSVS